MKKKEEIQFLPCQPCTIWDHIETRCHPDKDVTTFCKCPMRYDTAITIMQNNYEFVKFFNDVDKSKAEDEEELLRQSDILDSMFKNTLTEWNKGFLTDIYYGLKLKMMKMVDDINDDEEDSDNLFIEQPLPVLSLEQETVVSREFHNANDLDPEPVRSRVEGPAERKKRKRTKRKPLRKTFSEKKALC